MIRFEHINKKFLLHNSRLAKKRKYIHALRNVRVDFPAQKTIGIVGESGSGKSTLAKVFMGLHNPTNGYFSYAGMINTFMKKNDWLNFYRQVAMVFQNPYGSLNPRFKVQDIIAEPLYIQKKQLSLSAQKIQKRTKETLAWVGLSDSSLQKHPHQFSGGQRQRIAIARALAIKPKIMVLDEPVSALDVSVQAQILNLLQDLKKEFGLSYLFISHDLSVVQYISDYVVVMYLGSVVEFGKTADIFLSPKHPYTLSLLKSRPSMDDIGKPFYTLEGEIPSPVDLPVGCSFAERCSNVKEICKKEFPQRTETSGGFFHCHFPLNIMKNYHLK